MFDTRQNRHAQGMSPEEILCELEARYRCMVEHAPEAIVVFDLDERRFVEANEQACKLFGLDRKRLLKTGPVEMSPARQPDGRTSADVAREVIDAAMAGENPTFEWIHLNASGQRIVCRIQLARVPSPTAHQHLVRAMLVDIGEQKEIEKTRERLRDVLDATSDLVAMADAEGRTIYLNPAGYHMLGLEPGDDPVGTPITEFLTEDAARRLRDEAVPAAIRNGRWLGESEFRSRQGRRVPTSQVLIAHHDDRGEVEYLSTIARDITDRLAAEKLEREMLHAQKLESLGVLAGGIAHDFNNVLVGVLGNVGMLLNKLEPGTDVHAWASSIQTAGQRAADLAHQMLAYSGKARVDVSDVHIDRMIGDVSELVAASISKKALLKTTYGADVPPIRGDATQIRQVVMNLIINASDALEGNAGEIEIRTAFERVDQTTLLHNHLGDAANRECVVCEIRDSGVGMDPSLLDRIFDPFFSTKFTGRGLGLAAVIGIVRAHDGAISVETKSGSGTEFRLVFPPAPRRGDDPGSKGRGGAREDWQVEGSVLIVDDEALVRALAKDVTEELGFRVIEAEDGEAGVRRFRESNEQIVAILVDLTMPGLSGTEVIERIRASHPDIPVVLTSGFSLSEAVRTGADAADVFLQKPFTPAQLENALREALTAR